MDPNDVPCILPTIPIEVILRISEYLNTTELGNLRLTCKQIENALYHSFANEFFARKQFMLTDFSLQALLDISKSRLGHSVRRLQISVEMVEPRATYTESDYGLEVAQRQRTFYENNLDKEMLAEAIGNLSNIEDLVIRDSNSWGRTRDNTAWHSYGRITEGEKGVGFITAESWGPNQEDRVDPCRRTLQTVLHAYALSGQHPKGLELLLRERGNQVTDAAFEIPEDLQARLIPALEKLEKLHLTVGLAEHPVGEIFEVDDEAGDNVFIPHASYYLCKFLSHTKNLKNLRLNGDRIDRAGFNRILSHLADPNLPINDETSQGISFPKLEEFSIGMAFIRKERLVAALRNLAPKLRSFEMWRMLIYTTQGTYGVVENEYDPESVRPEWARTWKEFSEIPDFNPRHIKLGYMQEQFGWHKRHNILFDGEAEQAYTGPNCKRFMEDMFPKIRAEKPRRVGGPIQANMALFLGEPDQLAEIDASVPGGPAPEPAGDIFAGLLDDNNGV